ncbi:MAG TPA: glycosyltransferase family 4 protein [Candidatus Moranbacteria bacterium]|nr:glycosyltransferase family 4 protein [Candidatus Moranbacteria bacterium]
MKILFISHSYPPIIGGVENQNYNLAQGLSKIAKVKIIANGKGKWWLPIFIPVTFIRAIFIMMNFDACLVGNGVLAPIAAALKFFHPKKKFFSIVHGLDITFAYKEGTLPKIYKAINIPSLGKLDKLFMVGNFTIEEAVKIGISKEKCVFIPNGFFIEKNKKDFFREDLSKIWGADTRDKKVILTSGRLEKRKGVAWFCENVMPNLSENILYVIAGDGADKNNIKNSIEKNNLSNRIKMLGYVSNEIRNTLFNTCDLFVQPNIKIPGDMEGFGLSVIEAASCKIPVIASRLEGLQDAIKDGKNGFLVESENAEKWIKKINAIFSAGPEFSKNFGKMAGKFVEENFTWEKISKRYLEEMEKVIK